MYRVFPGESALATTSSCTRTIRESRCGRCCTHCDSSWRRRAAGRTLALADSSRRRRLGATGLRGRFRSDHGSAPKHWWRGLPKRDDNYTAIMAEALADRLAEAGRSACTSRRGARGDSGAKSDSAGRLLQSVRGIRPAPGYPARPDHTGEDDAVWPAGRGTGDRHPAHGEFRDVASGFGERLLFRPYRTRDTSRWCTWVRIRSRTTRRTGQSVAETERWLAPYLAYEPSA